MFTFGFTSGKVISTLVAKGSDRMTRRERLTFPTLSGPTMGMEMRSRDDYAVTTYSIYNI